MKPGESTKRASIDVKLDAGEVFALIEASFRQAKTATTRMPDHGWTIERNDASMIITTKHHADWLLEPLPDDYVALFPETLGLQVDVAALPEGGSRVRARLIRRRVGTMVGAVFLDMIAMSTSAFPFAHSCIHATDVISHRKNRRAAKLRLLRLAIEPLVPHQQSKALGVYRK